MKEIMEKLDIAGLSQFVAEAKDAMDKVPLLEKALKELSATKDDDLANLIAPPANVLAWSQKDKRPSQKQDNKIEEGDELLKNKPETGWLSEATNTKAIPTT